MVNEQFHQLLDTIEAPYDTRTQRMIRRALNDHQDPHDQVNAIIQVVEDLGLRPPEEVKPLPEITIDDVHLVCWMALVGSVRPIYGGDVGKVRVPPIAGSG